MNIHLNGEPLVIDDGLSLLDFLVQLEVTEKRIAVDLNRSVIPQSEYEEILLKEGDRVEVVTMIGGG